MPFAFSAGQPRGRASSCRAQARGGRRLTASIAVDGRAALPSGGGVAAGVCSQLLQCAGLGGLAALVVGVGGGCFPAEIWIPPGLSARPPQAGGLRRRRTAAHPRRHTCRTHDRIPGRTLLRIRARQCSTCSRFLGVRPMRAFARGAHTAKSNRLGRLPTLRVWLRHAVATARPLRIARGYGGFTPSPRPSPSGEGCEGSRPLRRGTGRRGRRPGHTSEARPRPKGPPSTQGKPPPEGPGNSPLTNCPPLWYSCPRGVASAAASSAALQHLQGSPGAAKARKVHQPSGLLFYPPLPTSATIAASNAPNATKPLYLVAFTMQDSHASV